MLAVRSRTSSAITRRSAFTLLEVLVVVAILVVLASVASIQVFRYLENSKRDKAVLDMQALEKAYNSYRLQNGGEHPPSQMELVPLLTQGQSSLIDPWDKQYQYRVINVDGEDRVQFFTTDKDGIELVWPRR